jgi:dipeptidyl aminopeptidase/acylaminoacyl peptidase
MLVGMKLYTGHVLLILSGNDLVAREFEQLTRLDKGWKMACRSSNVEKHWLHDANHTFSTRDHRDQVSNLTQQWLEKLHSITPQ